MNCYILYDLFEFSFAYQYLRYPSYGLYQACLKGYLKLVKNIIQKRGVRYLDINWALEGACQGGHRDLAELMIQFGADDWKIALDGAYQAGMKPIGAEARSGMRDLAEWITLLHAYNLSNNYGPRLAHPGDPGFSKWMIQEGDNKWNWCLMIACEAGYRDLAELFIQRGATRWNWGLTGARLGGMTDLEEWMFQKGASPHL